MIGTAEHSTMGTLIVLVLVLAGCASSGHARNIDSHGVTPRRPTSTTTAVDPTTSSTAATSTTVRRTTSTSALRLHASGSPATTAPVSGPCGRTTSTPATYRHVVWIWMENKSRAAVLGNGSAPYETALADGCATATDYRNVGRPSLPNYIGATSGSTQGITDDAPPADHPLAADNIFRQVRRSGGTARTYAEAMPGPCTLDATGRYAERHNPAIYYVGEDDRSACQRDDVALGSAQDGALAGDIAAGTLPRFAVIVPDLCDDTHNCGVSTGDSWLHTWIDRLVSGPDYASGSTAIFVVWDEQTPMPFIAVAPPIVAGASTAVAVDHFALLRTTEELLGITDYLGAAASAPSLRPLLGL